MNLILINTMIYLHRFIYAVISIPLMVIAFIIMLITFIIVTPFYALIYYIAWGELVSDNQISKLSELSAYPIFKFLEFIHPNDERRTNN